jgi:hypothetical protein
MECPRSIQINQSAKKSVPLRKLGLVIMAPTAALTAAGDEPEGHYG